jgi:formylglycine-generating enzyme required for sulfatase activity
MASRALLAMLLLMPGLAPSLAVAQETFRDCPDCPLMIWVPSGSFIMGAPPGEEEREGLPQQFRGTATPQSQVAVPRFALGVHTVTRGQFLAFAAATGRLPGPGCWHMTDTGGGSWRFQDRGDLNWYSPGFDQADNEPIVCVSWDDATAYAAWLASRTGRRYRLPSEAEWEYAARAATPGPRWWGAVEAACEHANVRDLSLRDHYGFPPNDTFFPCVDGFPHTAPVGSFRANPFGLHDMLGNVQQWTADCWNPNLRGQPANGAARSTGQCALRIVRGGDWISQSRFLRAGNRNPVTAAFRYAVTGFRVARTP